MVFHISYSLGNQPQSTGGSGGAGGFPAANIPQTQATPMGSSGLGALFASLAPPTPTPAPNPTPAPAPTKPAAIPTPTPMHNTSPPIEMIGESPITKEMVHRFLEIAGLLPGTIGASANVAQALLYIAEGDYVSAAISLGAAVLAVVPVLKGKVVSKEGGKLLGMKVDVIDAELKHSPVLKGKIPDKLPSNFYEQLALQSAEHLGEKNPDIIMRNLGDTPRLKALYGDGEWVKMEYQLRSGTNKCMAVVHWFCNVTTKTNVEFKFKPVKK